MHFPTLLTVALGKARIAKIVRPARHGQWMTIVDPAELLHPGSVHPVSLEKIRDVISSSTEIVWIGGSEPLEHPGIAHLVRALATSGHLIFLETNGILLRRRIHEFQPLPGLFLVVRLDPRQKREFELAIEGLRAARLSGFYTVIRSDIDERSDVDEFPRLRNLLLEMDVDGWLVTSSSANSAVVANAVEARKLIPSAAWRRFSRHVEQEFLQRAKSEESRDARQVEKRPTEACEESVKVA